MARNVIRLLRNVLRYAKPLYYIEKPEDSKSSCRKKDLTPVDVFKFFETVV